MALFDMLRKRKSNLTYAKYFDGFAPIFSMRGRDIYASDIVQQCLACISQEMSKALPKHIVQKANGSVTYPARADIQKVLDEPNEYMTTSDFLEKIINNLMLNYNVFIYPIYDVYENKVTKERKKVYKKLYPLQPIEVTFLEDASKKLFVEFKFADSSTSTIPYENIIHIRKNYSVNEYLGGDQNGQPDNRGIQKMIDVNEELIDSVVKTIAGSYAVNGIVKYNTYLDEGKVQADIEKLEAQLKNNTSGLLGLDLKGEYIPITRDLKMVDKDTLEWIDSVILRHYGVPLAILTGDYTKTQKEAWYEKCLEPIIIKLGQEFTKKLFTPTEKSKGHKVLFYPKELVFMTIEEKLKMIEILSPTGSLFENEKREILGLPPKPELEGQRKASLNWIDINIVNEYQLNNLKNKKAKEE